MIVTIIANGLFPTREDATERIVDADWVVCCDGSLGKYLNWRRQQSFVPSHRISVVGDGDSIAAQWLTEASSEGIDLQHVTIAEQEDNDLTKAVRHVMESAAEHIEAIDILGATGLREDHTIGNVSLLAYYAQKHPEVRFRIISDYGIMIPMQGHGRFDAVPGQQISLFSLTPQVPISVKGLRYPINNRRIEWWWEATLNEALEDHFEVSGGTIIVYLKHIHAN